MRAAQGARIGLRHRPPAFAAVILLGGFISVRSQYRPMSVGLCNLMARPRIKTVRRRFIINDNIDAVSAVPIIDKPVDLLPKETIESVPEAMEVSLSAAQ